MKKLLCLLCAILILPAVVSAEHLSAQDAIAYHNGVDTTDRHVDCVTEIPDNIKHRIYTSGVFAGFFEFDVEDCPYEIENWRLLWFDGFYDGRNFRINIESGRWR